MIQEDDGAGPLRENLGTSHERFPDKSSSGVLAVRMCATFTVKKIDGTTKQLREPPHEPLVSN